MRGSENIKYKSYSKEFKQKVVEDYLNNGRHNEICAKYEICKSQLHHWKNQWKKYRDFPDGRGKATSGRPKNIRRNGLTDKEYIKQLEMEVDILKYMAFLKKKRQK